MESSRRVTKTVVVLVIKAFVQHRTVVNQDREVSVAASGQRSVELQ